MTRIYKLALIVTMTIAILISNIAQAQKQFGIIDLQKMCDYSLTQMKTFALAQKISYSTASASDNDYDRYSYNDGSSITTIQKNKKSNLLIVNTKSEEYYLKVKESLEDFGYKYSSTTDGTPAFIYYQSENYTTALYTTTNNTNQDEYHIAVSKKVKVRCEEFTITELQIMCNYSYTDLEKFIQTKGYKVAQTDRSYLMAIILCNASKSNSLIIHIGKSVELNNCTYSNKLTTQIKSKPGYKSSSYYDKETGSNMNDYNSENYSVAFFKEKDKEANITITNKKSSATSNDSENSNESEEKSFAKKLSNGKMEIDSYANTTDINIKKGDKINISASGSVTYGAWAGSGGPDGIDGYTSYNRISGFRHGSLLVRIGDNGEWEAIGTSKSIVAKNNGVLQFIVNDGDPSNNSGAFTVDIRITKAR